jgi:hypothetical protein
MNNKVSIFLMKKKEKRNLKLKKKLSKHKSKKKGSWKQKKTFSQNFLTVFLNFDWLLPWHPGYFLGWTESHVWSQRSPHTFSKVKITMVLNNMTQKLWTCLFTTGTMLTFPKSAFHVINMFLNNNAFLLIQNFLCVILYRYFSNYSFWRQIRKYLIGFFTFESRKSSSNFRIPNNFWDLGPER